MYFNGDRESANTDMAICVKAGGGSLLLWRLQGSQWHAGRVSSDWQTVALRVEWLTLVISREVRSIISGASCEYGEGTNVWRIR
jgi:hypothetical protein